MKALNPSLFNNFYKLIRLFLTPNAKYFELVQHFEYDGIKFNVELTYFVS